MPPPPVMISVVVPVWARSHNLEHLIPSLLRSLEETGERHEVIVAASGARTERLARRLGARFVRTAGRGYGEILRAGLEAAAGSNVITMDADFSHRPGYVRTMLAHRDHGDVLLASRYVRGAVVEMSIGRRVLSRILNFIYRKALSVPYRDISSGFRMYRREVLDDILPVRGRALDVLPEMVVKSMCQGWKVHEVPFAYQGAQPFTRARMLRLSFGFLGTLARVFALRNSVRAADYDHRAFDSWIPLQRYWQRARFRIVHDFVPDGGRILDIGCGSSRIVQTLPHAVGMDLAIRKLRWLRAPGRMLLQGDLGRLPFPDASFDALVCSEVIEHIPRDQVHLEELVRVIRPGGRLILGTPDYSRRLWRTLEWVYGKVFPGGYVSEHINRYTYSGLRADLEALGLKVVECRYVGRSEMIFLAIKPDPSSDASIASTAVDIDAPVSVA